MSQSFRQISAQTARQIKLVMTDVDGTIASGGEQAGPGVPEAVRRLEQNGITVGLVSGRTLPELEQMARDLDIHGPIIAENGGVAKFNVNGELIDLGHSRKPALDALEKLQALYPGLVKGRVDNKDRIIDVVFFSNGVKPSELRNHIGETQLLDSGYVLHLMQAGINKGNTLNKVLGILPRKDLSIHNVIIFGDSLTDKSLFELFPHSVLVPNPTLDSTHRRELEEVAGYISNGVSEAGFIEVTSHILSVR